MADECRRSFRVRLQFRSRRMIAMTETKRHARRYPARTGTIWRSSEESRRCSVHRVCAKLRRAYGLPRFGNPRDPLDDLIYIILSNRSSPARAAAVFRVLKREFARWQDVLRVRSSRLQQLLEPLGLSVKRARHIRGALRSIRTQLGSCDLRDLRRANDDAVRARLVSLPGVSDKVAKCVMMYTLGRDVLPVDTHVFRIAHRLGWVDRKRADQCHEELEALVPPNLRYGFHVGCIAHGRTICRPRLPRCEECALRGDCHYFQDQRSN